MMLQYFSAISTISFLLLPGRAVADQILKTSGFSTCIQDSNITVQVVDIEYDKDSQTVTFNVAGTSSKVQNVTASLNVDAYGTSVYQNTFNPCDAKTFVSQLCPIPAGSFAASGVQEIPPSYATLIPSIAFSVPDIAATATLSLKSLENGEDVACITSQVSNGKTVSVPAVSYVAAGIAGAAMVMTGISALGAAAGGGIGAGTISPSIGEVFGVFQGFAMNGMMSVNLPPVVRSWTRTFAFSTGLIPWATMQNSIDSFRQRTGGNLTADSVQFLQNATLVFGDGSNATATKRSLAGFMNNYLAARDSISTSVNQTAGAATNGSKIQTTVSGIKAFAEELAVPQANTFMTVLLIVAVIMVAIAVSILLLKVILEAWAMLASGSYPKSLVGFRKHYWNTMARTLVQLILVLYSIWVLYTLFEFTHGDSWAAKTLAGITLALFTGVLAWFTFKIFSTARRLKQAEGDASGLYDNKENWLKYSIFYDCYKKDCWYVFIPVILYMLARGVVVAMADGHGLSQTIAQLVIESLMLGFLIWSRPYERKSGNVINIFIQIVRLLSVVCILTFVEELGISQTTQTITGVVLIAVQSVLTGALAILISVNAIIMCCKENPHRKRRKEAEKLNRDLDNLTPLDARNTLLMDPAKLPTITSYGSDPKYALAKENSNDSFMHEPANPYTGATPLRLHTPQIHPALRSEESRENLVRGAAPLGGFASSPPQQMRQPRIPDLSGYGGGYRGAGY